MILRLMPRKIREDYERNIANSGIKISPEKYALRNFLVGILIAGLISSALFLLEISPVISFILAFFVSQVVFYFKVSLKATTRIRKMENAFPDFMQLMASNLRAGMTLDRAFLLSARPEMAPLDEEIAKTGREIATGKDIIFAFRDTAKRINSEKIEKTISLIIAGLKEGGNIASLLENTSSSMREKEFLEKRAASNVLMYIIFIFVAVGFGAPILFGLSSILVEIIVRLTSQISPASVTQFDLPFTLSAVGLSSNFIIYFSVIFLIVNDIISSLVIGLVNKGDEKYGLRYMFPLIALSLTAFFIVRVLLYRFLVKTFAVVS